MGLYKYKNIYGLEFSGRGTYSVGRLVVAVAGVTIRLFKLTAIKYYLPLK